MNTLTTFYIVRHGESEANVQQIVQGAVIDTPLTEVGRKQAAALADVFRDIKLDAVYSSTLLRAKETGQIIADRLQLPLVTSDVIKERSFGTYEGMLISEFLEKYPDFSSLSVEEIFDFQIDEQEETNREGMHRLIAFLKTTSEKHQEESILIVTHGGVIRPFLIHTTSSDFDTIGGLDNCGYIKVEATNNTFKVTETRGIKTWDESIAKHTKQ